MAGATKEDRILYYQNINFGGVSDWAVDLDKDYGSGGIGSGDLNDSGGRNCPLGNNYKSLDALAADNSVADDCKPVLALGVLETLLDESLAKYEDTSNGYDENFAAYRRIMKESVSEAAFQFFHWFEGDYTKYFDCKGYIQEGKKTTNINGPCTEMQDHSPINSVIVLDVSLRDESGFYDAVEKDTGAMADWVYFDKYELNNDPSKPCGGKPPTVVGGIPQCDTNILSRIVIRGIPKLTDDFEIPDPKDIIKEISGNLEEIRDGMAARFFDIVAGIWDGGNGDVLQVYSVPIFLLSQAVGAMHDASEMGAEIREQEKDKFITLIISALLFFVPFVGQFAAMAAGAATIARMIAITGMAGNAAFSIVDIIENPENAAMAIVGLLTAGRVRKPRDFIDLGAARRAQTKAGVAKMGDKFKQHDDSLQRVLGNCRKDGGKDDDEPNICLIKRDADHGYIQLVARDLPEVYKRSSDSFFGLAKRQKPGVTRACKKIIDSTVTTATGTRYTTPAITCPEEASQACHHYSSVMSVHTNIPDMVRWTCWATESTGRDGQATKDWGFWNYQKGGRMPRVAQHNWDWGYEWTEWAEAPPPKNKNTGCQMDEWPPHMFWGANKQKPFAKSGQRVRLLPGPQNRKGGEMWNGFCEKHDGWEEKAGGVTKLHADRIKTTAQKVEVKIGGGLTTSITSVGIEVPNAVFEIKHWEHKPLKDDGLWDNPCWPSMIAPDDPGYALLIDDEWYTHVTRTIEDPVRYKIPPPQALTRGVTKLRMFTHPNHPGPVPVGLRDHIWEADEGMDSGDATPFTYTAPFGGGEMAGSELIVEEDGRQCVGEIVESVEICAPPPPDLTQPATTEAVASDVPASESEELFELAKPGSSVLDGSAEPTQGL